MKKIFTIFILWHISLCVFAQGEANNWYFGASAGITFNTDPPTCLLGGQTQIQEGCATVSDRFGNLMFYTDGQKVWNKNHKIMPNGTGLTGDPSSTQSGMFVPNPKNPSEYYVFTVSAVGTNPCLFSYSTIDITADGGLGAIKTAEKNIQLFDDCTEQVTAVASGDRKGYWVLGSQFSSNDIYSYYVGPNGLNTTPVISTAPFKNYQVGQLKVSPDGKKAVKITKNGNVVEHELCFEIYDFDDMTGKLSNPVVVPGKGLSLGFEFSPDGTKLYAPQKINSVGRIVVYDLTAGSASAILNSLTTVGNTEAWVFQLGPDGKIYIPSSTHLSVIENPNDPSSQLQISYNKIDLCGGVTNGSLPQFIQSNLLPTVQVKNKCLGDITSFEFSLSATNIKWNFNDPTSASNTATGINATHKFTAVGKYNVSVTFDAYGASESAVIPVEINEFIVPDASKDIEKCFGEKVALSYLPVSGLTYQWSTGEVGSKIEVFNAGTYWVESNNKGCKVKEEIIVSDGDCSKPIIDTIKYCNTATVPLSVEQAVAYKWSTGATTQSIVHTISAGKTVTVEISKLAANAMANPDFQSSLASYTSDYTLDPNTNSGQYYVTSVINNSPVKYDHTSGNGTGKCFYANTDNSKPVILRQKDIPVVIGTKYILTFWVCTPDQNHNTTQYHVKINGVDMSGVLSSPSVDSWTKVEIPWTADANTADIQFTNNATRNGRIGFDDISLSFVIKKKYEYRLVEVCLDCKGITFDAYSFCTNGLKHSLSVTPSTTSSCSNIQWYATESASTVLQTGCTFTTPVLSSATSYWLYDKSSDNGCKRTEYKVARATVCFEKCGNGLDDDNDGEIDEACEPFVCDGTLYLINSDKLFMQTMSLDPVSFTPFTPIVSSGTPIGYNPVDNFIYALEETGLQRIDSKGISEDLAKEVYLPDNKLIGTICAGFGSDGLFYFIQSTNVYALDVTTLKVKLVMSSIKAVWDIAQNPKDGFFYGVTGSNLYKFDMTAGTQVNLGSFGVTVSQAGSAFFDPSGALIIGAYGGAFVKIDVNTVKGTVIDPGSPTVNGYDGTSCAAYVLVNKTASKKTLAVGDKFTYTIDIYNETGGALSNLVFEDIVDARFELTSIVSNNLGAIAAGTGVGKTSIRIENINLPLGKTSMVFEVKVKDGSYCANELIPNQASLTNLPVRFGVTTLSDDPTTAKLKDETVVTITGASASLNAGSISAATIESCSPLKDTIKLTGYTGSIKWEHSTDKVTWSNLTTANSDTYFLPLLKTNSGNSSTTEYYRARVFCGSSVKYSDIVSVITHPNSKVDLGNDTTLCTGATVSLDAKAGFDKYLWNDGTKNQKLSVTTTGAYSVTVTKGTCSDVDTVNVTFNALPVANIGNDTTLCTGNTLVLDAKAGFDKYLWSDGTKNQKLSVTTTGAYSVTVTKGTCSNVDTVNVTFNALPVVNLGKDTAACGDVTLNAGVFSKYSWNTGETTATIKANSSSIYSVTVTQNGCTDRDSIDVTIDGSFEINPGNDTTLCDGDTLLLDARAGFDKYLWSDGSKNQKLSVTTTGAYSVTVTKGTCSDVDTVNVTFNALPVVNLGKDTAACGAITLNAGTFNKYSWNTGETTATIKAATSSIYSVTVTQNGCIDRDSIDVTIDGSFEINPGKDTTLCDGDTLVLDARAGFDKYLWSDGSKNQKLSVTTTGAYSVTVTKGTCSDVDTVNVTFNALPVVNLGKDTAACGDVTLNAGVFSKYSWNTGETTATIKANSSSIYSVTVTQNGCTDRDSIDVTIDGSFEINPGKDTTLCDGDTLVLDARAGFDSYKWNDGSTKQSLTVTTTGAYSVTVTKGTCSDVDTVNVTFNALPVVNLGKDTAACGAITLNAGTFNKYSWNTGETTATIKAATSSIYSVTVTQNGCIDRDSIDVTIDGSFEINPGKDTTLCDGDTLLLDARAGFDKYLWSDGSKNQKLSVTTTGAYSVTVTKGTCSDVDTVNVIFNALPVVNLGKDTAACGAITLNAGTFNKYSWNTGETTATIKANSSSIYSVTVTQNGCTDRDSIDVTIDGSFEINPGKDTTLCDGDTLVLDARAGFDKYLWNDGTKIQKLSVTTTGAYSVTVTKGTCSDVDTVNVTFATPPTINLGIDKSICKGDSILLDAGTSGAYLWNTGSTVQAIWVSDSATYSVSVSVGTCSASDSVSISVLPLPIFSLGPDTTYCPGAKSSINFLQNDWKYSWNDGTWLNSMLITKQGNYSLTVTSKDGCTYSDTVKILYDTLPKVIATTDTSFCKGDSIALKAVASKGKLVWNWHDSTSNTIKVSPTKDTTYEYVVRYGNGCEHFGSTKVKVRQRPVIDLDDSAKVCKSINIDAGAGFDTYLWSNGQNTQNTMLSQTGMYRLTVTKNDCPASDSIYINISNEMSVNLGADLALCSGDSLRLDAHLADTYEWSTGEQSRYLWVKNAGSYRVSVTSGTCKASDTVTVTIKPLPIITKPADVKACQFANISVGTYDSYLWSTGQTSNAIKVTKSNTYYITVTQNACKASDSVKVVIDSLRRPNLGKDTTVCDGQGVTLNAGKADTYLWSDGSKLQTLTSKTAGVFSLTVTNGSCTSGDTIQISSKPYPQFNLGNDTVLCANQQLLLNQKIANASYNWYNNSTLASQTIKAPGGKIWLDVTVNACTTRDTIQVSFTSLPDFTIIGPAVRYQGDSAYYEVSREFAAYQWNTGVLKRNITPKLNTDETFVVAVANQYNCRDSAYISVKVLPLPQIAIQNKTICAGSSVTVSPASKFDSYEWSTGETTASITIKNQGTYIVKASRTNEPDISLIDTFSLTVIPLPEFTISNDTSFCDGNSAPLYVSPEAVFTYKWTDGSKQSSIRVSTSGIYTVTVTAFGCEAHKSVNVKVIPIPAKPQITGDSILCYNESNTLLNAGGDSIIWYDADKNILFNEPQYYYTLNKNTSVLYASQTVNSCESPQQAIVLKKIPLYTDMRIVISDSVFCQQANLEKRVLGAGVLSHPIWKVTGNNKIQPSVDSLSALVSINAIGVDTLTLITTDEWGCSYSVSKQILIVPNPQSQFNYNISNGTVYYNNQSVSGIVPESKIALQNMYYWSLHTDSAFEINNAKSFKLHYTYGYYDVQLVAKNQYGCVDTSKQNIFVDYLDRLYFPNVFYPKHPSSEINSFRPKGSSLKSYEIFIFDQWGNQIWYSNKLINGQPAEGWNGKYNDNDMKPDAYIWKVDAQFLNGQQIESMFGNVILLD